MDKIAAVPFAKKGDKQVLAFTCHNEGRDNITNAKFGHGNGRQANRLFHL